MEKKDDCPSAEEVRNMADRRRTSENSFMNVSVSSFMPLYTDSLAHLLQFSFAFFTYL